MLQRTIRNTSIIYFLVSTVAVLIIYGQVLNHQFLEWDDTTAYVNNPHLQGFSLENWWWILTSPGDGIWKPLTYLSFMFQFWCLDISKAGLHLLVNPFLHAVNATLVGLLVCQALSLLSTKGVVLSRSFDDERLAGLLAALLFAVHPLNVEAAVWLSGRKELLSAGFYLAAVLAWLNWCESDGRARGWFMLALVAQFLALLCKSMAVSLPCVLLLVDWLLRRHSSWRVLILEKWPFWLLSVLTVPVAIWGQQSVGALSGVEESSLLVRLAQGLDTYASYLSKFVFPVDLSPFYPALTKVDILRLLGEVALLAIGVAATICFSKGSRVWMIVIGWYVIVFFPVAGWIQIADHRMADRYAYLPAVPLFGVAAVLLLKLRSTNYRQIFAYVAVLVVGVYAWLAFHQATHWRNDRTLWEYALRKQPEAPLVLLNLGVAYIKEGENEKGLAMLADASSRSGHDIYYLETWMMACSERRRWECALSAALLGTRNFPEDYHFYVQAGFFSGFLERHMEAADYFAKAVSLAPDNRQALWGRAYTLVKLQRHEEAVVALDQLLEFDPSHAKGRQLRQSLLVGH